MYSAASRLWMRRSSGCGLSVRPKAKNHKRAIAQLNLARQLAPRDIFVLRHLGKALIDAGDLDEARKVLDRIDQLDRKAVVQNTECAALAARWHRVSKNLKPAQSVLEAALKANPQSYYLADLLAQVYAEDGRATEAAAAYREVLRIIEKLEEDGTWAKASTATARFFLGEDEQAIALLQAIRAKMPDAGAWASIERGLSEVAGRVDNGLARLAHVLAEARA